MRLKQTKIWRFFSSIRLAIWLLALIAAISVIGTVIPQNKPPEEYIKHYGNFLYNVFTYTGITNLYSAWWFILLLGLLFLNLTVCFISRFSLKGRSLGTSISHMSVLVILTGALIGMFFGEKGYVRIREGESADSFVSESMKRKSCCPVKLDFSVRLDDFIYEENIDSEEQLLVYSAGDELLKEIPFEIGRETEITGNDYSVKILRYVPDFVMDVSTKEVVTRSSQPRNPAIEVELKGEDSVETFWVFAAHPNVHKQKESAFKFAYRWVGRHAKDFLSKVTVIKDGEEVMKKDVRVNSPLKFEGYTFFQSSYDTEHLSWTGLQVVKDPGVPVVYLGFILLIVGLSIRFYIPYRRK